MFGTALAQLRFGASVAFGLPFAPWSLDWLIDGLLATRREFGGLEADGGEILDGPDLDADMLRDLQTRRFRAQARHALDTPYYRALFAAEGLDPARLTGDDIPRLPVTPKADLRDRPDAFVSRDARPAFRTTTTGTTGAPTSVLFSDHEMRLYGALNALAYLRHGQITPQDVVQINASARATLGNTCFAQACQRIGAVWTLAGLVDPALSLALLAERHDLPGKKPQVSFLNVYPSYLGELIETGQALGYRPADFGLARIAIGGEIVTAGLKARAQEVFGGVEFIEGYGMTETWPVGGTVCEQGHLHFEPSMGLVETLRPASDTAAQAGEPARLVVTPFPQYRQTTLVLRFDTEDVVTTLAEPLTCRLRRLPATGPLLGKARLGARQGEGWLWPRALLEALEGVDDVPLPARFGYWPACGGVAVEVVARADTPAARRRILAALEAQRVPVRQLMLHTHPSALARPYPLRCDLREASFRPTETADMPALSVVRAVRALSLRARAETLTPARSQREREPGGGIA